METSIKVAVRIRPQSAVETRNQKKCLSVHMSTDSGLPVVCIKTSATRLNLSPCKIKQISCLAPLQEAKVFSFDNVFDENSTQSEVYEALTEPMLQKFFTGINCTILAYGQTGSGKSYTMGTGIDSRNGAEEFTGIVPSALNSVFYHIQKTQSEAISTGNPNPEFNCTCSFVEIYNEELRDLLNPPNKTCDRLQIREEKDGTVFVVGAKEPTVSSPEEAMAYLRYGSKLRETAQTAFNDASSRSHAIFTLTLHQTVYNIEEIKSQYNINAAVSTERPIRISSKLHFVDLAGSERLKRTNAEGDRKKEGININQGLLVLGKVVNALAEQNNKILAPFRESKLTRILQNSLGGNSSTTMITCVSPFESDYYETLNSMMYASRARNIKNFCHINITDKQHSMNELELMRTIEALQSEIDHLKSRKNGSSDKCWNLLKNLRHFNSFYMDGLAKIASIATYFEINASDTQSKSDIKHKAHQFLTKSSTDNIQQLLSNVDISSSLGLIAQIAQMHLSCSKELKEAEIEIDSLLQCQNGTNKVPSPVKHLSSYETVSETNVTDLTYPVEVCKQIMDRERTIEKLQIITKALLAQPADHDMYTEAQSDLDLYARFGALSHRTKTLKETLHQ